MNKYKNFIISDEDYLASGRSRLAHLINLGYNPEDIISNKVKEIFI